MQAIRSQLITAAFDADIRTIIRLTDLWPQVLNELNEKGETPMREYLNCGGRVRGIIANITPSFVPDFWPIPPWYGTSAAISSAKW